MSSLDDRPIPIGAIVTVRYDGREIDGELLGIAGEPDFRSEEGAAYGAPTTVQSGRHTSGAARVAMSVRTYTYLPTPGDPSMR